MKRLFLILTCLFLIAMPLHAEEFVGGVETTTDYGPGDEDTIAAAISAGVLATSQMTNVETETHASEHTIGGADPIDRLFEGVTVAALTVGDATPAINSKYLYNCTGGTTITITDFVDSDGDHSEFSDGDYFGVLMNDSDIEIDFSNNSNIEGNADTDFTGSASQIVLLTFVFQGSTWYCENYNMGFSDPLTFASKIKKGHVTDADGFTMTAAQAYNYTIYATGAGTITFPPVAEGMHFCIENHTAADVITDMDATGTEDTARLDGQALAQGDGMTGTDFGDILCCEYYAADTWSCMGSGYVDSN